MSCPPLMGLTAVRKCQHPLKEASAEVGLEAKAMRMGCMTPVADRQEETPAAEKGATASPRVQMPEAQVANPTEEVAQVAATKAE